MLGTCMKKAIIVGKCTIIANLNVIGMALALLTELPDERHPRYLKHMRRVRCQAVIKLLNIITGMDLNTATTILKVDRDLGADPGRGVDLGHGVDPGLGEGLELGVVDLFPGVVDLDRGAELEVVGHAPMSREGAAGI